MSSTAAKRVFLADLSSIERRLSEIESIEKQNALERGMLLKLVRDNDLTHGQWLRWLESVSIGERTAQRCIQAYEQFGNTTQASDLSISTLFELIQLPDEIERSTFLGRTQPIPSTGERKFVSEMSRAEIREVVRASREAGGVAKQEMPRGKKAGASKSDDVWADLESMLGVLSPLQKETVERLPLSMTRKVIELPEGARTIVLEVADKLAQVTFTDHSDAIISEASKGTSASTIARKYLKQPDSQSLSGVLINPYEILGVQYGESEAVVRKKYRELMKSVHPDKGGSALLFKLVNKAYEAYLSGRFSAS
ncbi:DnaJ domain-containing protein [Paenibacillus glucanolyticus]|uniref:DnaJ domain-containing protein n=1 Tax=Paenibacillus glucanolyticus TaxID=59843 RepID=UPI00096E21E8|nr:DnaJ domain-containing protein [Paenibacillus glucanolyticus]OMF73021.1 hypothetical protein BK142_19320 [Paenibacillus glucanolyticus]